jgi:hypothetical protein
MNNFTKIVRVGVCSAGSIYANIGYTDGKLSITGVVGPTRDGNCRGSCGQIEMSYREGYLDPITPAPGWDASSIALFFDIWRDWHLNDMQAGSPAQEAWLKEHPIEDRLNYYTKACEALAAAGLNPDPGYIHKGKPYRYGHAWLRVEVPAHVLAFLQALPDTDKQPAWI